MCTSSAEQMTIRVPIEGLVLPRSTRLSIEGLSPVIRPSACSVSPFWVRNWRILAPIVARV